MKKYKVLSTKTLEPSLVEQAKQSDIEIIEQEFISVKPIWTQETLNAILELIKGGKNYIALTSVNAVDVLSNYLAVHNGYSVDWKIFCLSGKTKQAIQNGKFLGKNIIGEAKDAPGLAKKIVELGVDEIIFFCSNKRRDELPTILKDANIKVQDVVLYETLETPVVVENKFNAILFFSPSAVNSFFQKNLLNDQTVLFAIGNTTANEIKNFSKNKLIVSDYPDRENLLKEMITYFQDNPIHPVRPGHPGGH
jgi:uroporphyrinogen-III synthase